GFFRYEGGQSWTACPLPRDNKRVVALAVYNGYLYAGSYDSCSVLRFDGTGWEDLGTLETSGQTYSFDVLGGGWYGRGGPTARGSSATRRASAGSRPGGWGRRRKSWAWRSTTASSTAARSRWRKSTATKARRTGRAPAAWT